MKKYILSILVLVALVALRALDPWPVEVARLKYFDFLERQQQVLNDERVVLVNIDEAALQKHGQWPWPRDVVARYVNDIMDRGAVVIVAPILFSEQDRSGKDAELEEALRTHRVILAQAPTTQVREPYARARGSALIGPPIHDVLPSWPGAIPPLPQFADVASGVGMIATMPEPDGVVRRSPMLVAVGENFYPSLVLETLRVLSDEVSFQVKSNEAGVEIIRIPGQPLMYTDANSRLWPVRSFNYQSYSITNLPTDLDGTVVILSITAEGFSNPVATSHGEMLPNMVIATELSSVLNQLFVTRDATADLSEMFIVLAAGGLMIMLALLIKIAVGGVIAVGFMGWLAYVSLYMRAEHMLLYDALYPIAALLIVFGTAAFSRALEEFRLKQQIKKQFGTYLSPDMVEKLQKNPELLKLGGETRELSIMFTDVRGFTTISEHYGQNVQGLTMIMNRYMTAMTAKILQNNGTLDKYIGDAQMAFWNAPLDNKNHAKDAVRTAIAMLDDLKRFNDEIAKEGVPPFGMGLGINTGSVVVGNMGSDQRFDYTCLGDSVNLAARLEGQSKPYGVKLVLGPKTASEVCDEFNVVELDLLAVKGKTEPVSIYTVVKKQDSGAVTLHKDFLRMYRRGQWSAAKALVKQLSTKFDGELAGYYEMMEERMQGKPPANFDGVYRATSK
ncbi:COG4252 Predicted transmembrane sensor domain [uncultured Caudovirales phage]|uniref:COG4252 Predicted transmembrane sensor domain n=1 Tax=uncultured Caudovirales phage TaxID=2100421 RepID=A0A6J5M272_9CAUD|nr:COG4252 Predicted transmembrane sensor domain [uncultured Caudovirales phage]